MTEKQVDEGGEVKKLFNMYLNEDGSITEHSSRNCKRFERVYLFEKNENIPISEFIAPQSMILPFPTNVILPDKIEIGIIDGRYQLTKVYRNEKIIWEKSK